MKSKGEASALRGGEGFEKYYSAIYGQRWPGLKKALEAQGSPLPWTAFDGGPSYYLDAASVLASLSLPLQGAKNILDMCAAPGGKSLCLASLMDKDGALRCNELSFERYKRLERVAQEHLPPDVQERVRLSCSDAALLCKKEEAVYDAILLDAPCSSERHVLNDPKYLAEWSPSRIKSLSMRQWALLSSAYRLLKSGGFLLYSTCAMNKSENSDLCGRLLKKFSDARALGLEEVRAVQDASKKRAAAFFDVAMIPNFEEEDLGFSILPDAQGGAGPIYFCLFKKN